MGKQKRSESFRAADHKDHGLHVTRGADGGYEGSREECTAEEGSGRGGGSMRS